ncbi:NifB/NifX family molybdenum-iron cluster-binding protein [Candidatus Kapabacteria bacterium]|nr:NifB/NifX family molybdenum-iron cluster-binding protein [Candidatus Kapabacteria bacterium]
MQKKLKVAFVSNDSKNIVGAFGSSKYFNIYTLEDNKIVDTEIREVYKDTVDDELNTLVGKNMGLGIGKISLSVMDPAKQKHMKMAKTIADCDVVVARKMCENAWDSVLQFKMKPIRTKNKNFEESIQQFIDGNLESYSVN